MRGEELAQRGACSEHDALRRPRPRVVRVRRSSPRLNEAAAEHGLGRNRQSSGAGRPDAVTASASRCAVPPQPRGSGQLHHGQAGQRRTQARNGSISQMIDLDQFWPGSSCKTPQSPPAPAPAAPLPGPRRRHTVSRINAGVAGVEATRKAGSKGHDNAHVGSSGLCTKMIYTYIKLLIDASGC